MSRLNDVVDRRGSGDPASLLAELGIEVAVRDARASGLRSSSIELSVSNNTLEHVAPNVLAGILGELRRVASAGGVSDHFIDMSDHYAHFDHSITEFNFLRYSDPVWRPLNNRLQYQNRLRLSDYRRLVEDAGFAIVAVEGERGSAPELDRIQLAPRFRGYSREDLLVLRIWVTAVARGPRGRAAAREVFQELTRSCHLPSGTSSDHRHT